MFPTANLALTPQRFTSEKCEQQRSPIILRLKRFLQVPQTAQKRR